MKPNLVPLSLALLVGAAQAQTEDQFEPWQTIGYTSAGPQDFTDGIDIAPADLDGDGLMDVVFSGKLQGAVFSAIWKGINDGNGGFSLSLAHVLGSQAGASVKTWDMDSDGDMDVVVARTSAGDDRLLWLENQGDGTFGTQHVLAASTNPATDWDLHEVHIGDLDGDGEIDDLLRVHGNYAGLVALELFVEGAPGQWSSAGAIQAPQELPKRIWPHTDWNQDGLADLICSEGQSVWVAYGTFTSSHYGPWFREVAFDARDFVPYDWNGDGKWDLVMGSGRSWHLYETDPTQPAGSRFSSTSVVWQTGEPDSGFGIGIADLDNDGQPECMYRDSTKLGLGLHTPSSGLSAGSISPLPLAFPTIPYGFQQILAVDYDGDGDRDIFVGGDKPGFIRNQRDAVEVLGTGCAGASLASSYAHQGGTWELTMDGVPATSSVGVFIFGNLPVTPAFPLGNSGCSVHTNGVFQSLTAPRVGTRAVLNMTVPIHPAVLGYSFTAQAVTAAPGTPLGFALTNGITATVIR